MNIQINEPCQEDWQAMTPNQQGAFCKVCHKDVVDFSKKSISQIKSFFAEKSEEKICGRFEKKQLAYLSFDDFFASFKYWVLSKKIALVFFFTLGFMTFDASAQNGTTKGNATPQTQTHMQGEPAVIPTPEPFLKGDVAYPQTDTSKKQSEPMMGKIKCTTTTVPKNDKPKKAKPQVMGGVTPIKKEDKNAK